MHSVFARYSPPPLLPFLPGLLIMIMMTIEMVLMTLMFMLVLALVVDVPWLRRRLLRPHLGLA